jgi:histidinol-phosphate/aromatic aminotransferase/cobyric acid decarboxylase-like protein
VIRYASLDGPWKCGPWLTQYKEYERSAKANGRVILSGDSADKAAVLALINPCNPTGDYMSVDKVAAWILENALPGATVLVDESMQPWHGPQFRDDSLASSEWVKRLHDEHGIHVYVIHSWTKLWSCTGIRLGSVVTPTAEHAQGLKRIQVPWSVNCLALAFLDAVTRDHAYLDKTWQVTPEWRALTVDWLTNECKFKVYGEPFLSWVLVNVDNGKPCRDKVEEMVKRARAAGVPVRDCRPGYYLDSYVRVAVRDPSKLEVLKQAWKGLENE